MNIVGNLYEISFSSKDIKQFNKIFANFMRNIANSTKIPNFKVDCTKEGITIQVTASPEGYNFIADIVEQIDNFSIEYTSNDDGLPAIINDKQEDQTEDVEEIIIPEEEIVVPKEVVVKSIEGTNKESEEKIDLSTQKEQQDLVINNQGLIRMVMSRLNVAPYEYDDVFSVGNIGLIKAAKLYDKSKGLKFSTFASQCIKNEILMYYRKENKHKSVLSFNDIMNNDKNKDANDLTFEDTLQDKNSTDFVYKIEDREILEKIINIVLNYFNKRKISVALYKMAGMNQAEIANELGISRTYVSRIEGYVVQDLKNILEEETINCKIYTARIFHECFELSFIETNSQFDDLLRFKTENPTLKFDVEKIENQIVISVPLITAANLMAKLFANIDSLETKNRSKDYKSKVDTDAAELIKNKSNMIINYIIDRDEISIPGIKEEFPDCSYNIITSVIKVLENKGVVESIKVGKYRVVDVSKIKTGVKSKTEIVMDYILSIDQFETRELFTVFPDCSKAMISIIIKKALKEKKITKIRRGVYVVNK